MADLCSESVAARPVISIRYTKYCLLAVENKHDITRARRFEVERELFGAGAKAGKTPAIQGFAVRDGQTVLRVEFEVHRHHAAQCLVELSVLGIRRY